MLLWGGLTISHRVIEAQWISLIWGKWTYQNKDIWQLANIRDTLFFKSLKLSEREGADSAFDKKKWFIYLVISAVRVRTISFKSCSIFSFSCPYFVMGSMSNKSLYYKTKKNWIEDSIKNYVCFKRHKCIGEGRALKQYPYFKKRKF